MSILSRLFGLKPSPKALSAVDWIVANTEVRLDVVEAGPLPTPEGKAAILDPLALMQTLEPNLIDVPTTGGRVVVFHEPDQGRNSKLALVFSDSPVTGGADVATCAVDAGMGSVFTPTTHTNLLRFIDEDLKTDPYNGFFHAHDDPNGGERKIVTLPDGTPIPYVHSGWGDGGYPVFTLTDADGTLCALYTDFMGKNDQGEYLTPPGVTLD